MTKALIVLTDTATSAKVPSGFTEGAGFRSLLFYFPSETRQWIRSISGGLFDI